MNKAYRSIWNEVLGAWVAVPENARPRGKSSRAARSAATRLALASVVGIAALGAGVAGAGTSIQIDEIGNGTATGTGGTAPATSDQFSIAIGGGSGATAQNASVAIGDESSATGQDSVAVGRRTTASGSKAVAVGAAAIAGAPSSVAIGDAAIVPSNTGGRNNIAIGTSATTGIVFSGGNGGSQIAIGRAATTQVYGAIAIGDNARATGNNHNIAVGTDANAVGNSALSFGRASGASGNFSTALGFFAQATNANSVALGSGSATAAPVGTASAEIAGVTHTFAGTAPTSTVSIGNAGSERTLTNLAAGRVSGSSTDAINGSQLFAANQEITALDTRVDTLGTGIADKLGTGAAYDPATGTLTGPTYNVGGNSYTTVKSAVEAAGAGWNLSADGGTTSDNIAPGETVDFAAGTNATVARSGNTITYGVVDNPTFSGTLTANGGLVVGANQTVDMGGNRVTNVGAGTTGTDAVNLNQLNAVSNVANAGWNLSAQGANATNVGPNSTAGSAVDLNNTDGNITVTKPADSNSVTFGLSNDLTIGNSIAVGGVGGTVINASGVTTGAGTGPSVTTSGIDAAGTRIVNVANGVDPSDAATVAQLTSATAAVQTHYYSVNDDSVQGGNYDNKGATGINSLAAGVNASAGALDATALGSGASAQVAGAVALGSGSVAATGAGVAGYVPPSAGATEQAAIAATLGTRGAVAVGDAGNGIFRQITGVAAGTADSDAVNVSQLRAVANAVSTAGSKWIAGSQNDAQYVAPAASGSNSTAVGSGASVAANNSVAVGTGAKATVDNSVALGNGSTTEAATPTASATIQGTTYNFAGAAPVGVVSVGSAGAERQVTNVAAGELSATSTDAVNGSQLYATNQAINNITTGGGGIKYFHANSSSPDSQAAGAESVAFGPAAIALGTNSMAGGANARAGAAGSVALGAAAQVTAGNGVALGSGAVADRAGMSGQRELFSNQAVQSAQGALSIGSAGGERQITHVAGGTQDTDAVNVRQLRAVQDQAAKYDTHADGSVNHNSMTLQGSGGTTIHNVADGVAGSDAATVNQVNQAAAASTAYTDARAGQLRDDIRNTAKDASAGTAGAMAMAGMPQAYIPGKSMVSAGVAGYDGQAAIAIGVSKLSDSGRWVVKFSGSANSRGKVGVSAGVGMHW